MTRSFAAARVGLVLLLAFSMVPSTANWLTGVGVNPIRGSLILIGMGLLHLGITSHVLRVVIGLMTVLSGFEILYSAVEGSVLVAGLLAVINLGLALVGAYLLLAQNAPQEETETL